MYHPEIPPLGQRHNLPMVSASWLPSDFIPIQFDSLKFTFSGYMDFSHYSQVVESYTARNLSFPSDRLDAFRGRLQHWTRTTGEEFLYGHPIRDLVWSIQWFPHNWWSLGYPRLRHFPSWSWADSSSGVRYCDDLGPRNSLRDGIKLASMTKYTSGGELRLLTECRGFGLHQGEEVIVQGRSMGARHYIRLQQDLVETNLFRMSAPHLMVARCPRGEFILEDKWENSSALTDFILLMEYKGSDYMTKRIVDIVIAMLIRRLEGGKVERVGITFMKGEDWRRAPLIYESEEIILV
ncbi:hypothetical protein VTL71DRAFT_14724 [Oculimacula yallundae]|uniref:Uncharacterized protein n=1 Tax=Oculimacula yallundae TaxID=86028 RepID=A0ABR4CJB0_9HELO